MDNKEISDHKDKLFSENQYLLEVIENLTKEAKKLEKFKKNILTSIECENDGSLNPSNNYPSTNLDKFKYIPKKIPKMNIHASKSIQCLSINSVERNFNQQNLMLKTFDSNKSIEKDNRICANINMNKKTSEQKEKMEFKLDNEKYSKFI